MPKRSSKKKQDLNKLALSIVEQATRAQTLGDEELSLVEQAEAEGKNIAAVMLGRLGGLKGGKARYKKLSAEERSKIAKTAAQARWKKNKNE
ncbi:MAG: hypothetical protein JW709_05320 [Sedimentisphaerales bacterium]|nr:hypothetical protein [Sedimentisphaerales bacterium]